MPLALCLLDRFKRVHWQTVKIKMIMLKAVLQPNMQKFYTEQVSHTVLQNLYYNIDYLNFKDLYLQKFPTEKVAEISVKFH